MKRKAGSPLASYIGTEPAIVVRMRRIERNYQILPVSLNPIEEGKKDDWLESPTAAGFEACSFVRP